MKISDKLRDGGQRCIDTAIGEKAHDYYNGALSKAETGRFERHLVSCPYCEKVILDLDLMLAALNDEQDFDSIIAGKASSGSQSVKEEATRKIKYQKGK